MPHGLLHNTRNWNDKNRGQHHRSFSNKSLQGIKLRQASFCTEKSARYPKALTLDKKYRLHMLTLAEWSHLRNKRKKKKKQERERNKKNRYKKSRFYWWWWSSAALTYCRPWGPAINYRGLYFTPSLIWNGDISDKIICEYLMVINAMHFLCNKKRLDSRINGLNWIKMPGFLLSAPKNIG